MSNEVRWYALQAKRYYDSIGEVGPLTVVQFEKYLKLWNIEI